MQTIGKIGTLLFPLLTFTSAHVSLMWPPGWLHKDSNQPKSDFQMIPARAPGLDFLDSFRTKGDCGVEEPRGAPRSDRGK